MIRQILPVVLAAGLAGCATMPAQDAPLTGISDREKSGALALFPALDEDAGPGKNVVFSPASVDEAFGLLRLGAAGETAAQLDAVLPAPKSADYLRHDVKGVEVRLANALFLSDDFRFRNQYVNAAKTRYGAEAERIDFLKPEPAAERINNWAEKATEGLISQVLTSDSITPDLVAILANALYFDGKWKTKLTHGSTRDFLFGDGSEKPFKFVGGVLPLKLVSKGGWKAVRLPYADERYVMDAVIPGKRAVMVEAPTLDQIEALADALANAEPKNVDITIPQFEVDYAAGLIPVLQKLGVTLPFDEQRADLSQMAQPGQQNIFVSDVRHVTKLQVFDEGTRAAAVTTVSIIVTSGRLYDPKPVPFTADQPFVFVIRDLEAGEVLFIGRIANPQEFTPEVTEP